MYNEMINDSVYSEGVHRSLLHNFVSVLVVEFYTLQDFLAWMNKCVDRFKRYPFSRLPLEKRRTRRLATHQHVFELESMLT